MTTLTPSQFEALPEAEKVYWKKHHELDYYKPTTISLKDAETIIKEITIEAIRLQNKMPDISLPGLIDRLTEAITELKERAK